MCTKTKLTFKLIFICENLVDNDKNKDKGDEIKKKAKSQSFQNELIFDSILSQLEILTRIHE